jgi:hypothetical protein
LFVVSIFCSSFLHLQLSFDHRLSKLIRTVPVCCGLMSYTGYKSGDAMFC